jgi:hypothetical protein
MPDGDPPSSWLRPPLVSAPNPDDRTKVISMEIAPGYIETNHRIRRLTPIFQLWAHVAGQLPPINNIQSLQRSRVRPTLTTLENAIAAFRGVRRPYDGEQNGESVVVYVLRPDVSIQSHASMVCMARAVKVPPETLLTVQACPVQPLQGAPLSVKYRVTRLEFVSSAPVAPDLPARHQDRYDKLLWKIDP